jgi:hypothetical protein
LWPHSHFNWVTVRNVMHTAYCSSTATLTGLVGYPAGVDGGVRLRIAGSPSREKSGAGDHCKALPTTFIRGRDRAEREGGEGQRLGGGALVVLLLSP